MDDTCDLPHRKGERHGMRPQRGVFPAPFKTNALCFPSCEYKPTPRAASTTQPPVRSAVSLGDRGHGAEAARIGSF
jgi:hypothetical protein